MADAVLAGEPCPSVPAAYGMAIDRVPAFFGTYLCMIMLTLLGALLCLLPGIHVAVALYFAPVRAAARERGPIAALRDSWALIKGRWWRVFGFILLVALCVQAVSLPLSLPMQWAATTGARLPAWYLPVLIAFSLLLGILQLVCNAALHRRLEQLGPVGSAPAPLDGA
jgi:hypothetical protein